MTFDPDAIPVAALMVIFGVSAFIFRSRVWAFTDERMDMQSSKRRIRNLNIYAGFLMLWSFALAAGALLRLWLVEQLACLTGTQRVRQC